MERRQRQRGGVISEVEDATYSVLRKHERSRSGAMRKFLFSWICGLRGMHRSGKKPKTIRAAYVGKIVYTLAVIEFRCLCGAAVSRTVDTVRGGRIPVPFEWPVEGKCL